MTRGRRPVPDHRSRGDRQSDPPAAQAGSMTTAQTQARTAATSSCPSFGMPAVDAGPARLALRRAPGAARVRVATSEASTGSCCMPTASTAPTSPTSPGSIPGSRRRCWSSARDGDPAILVGNECFGMAGAAPLPMRRHLLPGPEPAQPAARPLAARSPTILADEGIGVGEPGRRGRLEDIRRPATRWTLPSYLVDELRRWSGPSGSVDERHRPAHRSRRWPAGRSTRSEQIAAFEYASCQTSNGVRRLLARAAARHDRTARPSRLLGWNGAPLSCHLMLTAGPRAELWACSARPTGRSSVATRSPPHSASGVPSTAVPDSWSRTRRTCRPAIGDYVERLVGPYFEAVAEWYEALHVGQAGRRPPGDRRPAPRRPVLRHLPQPRSPAASRRMGQLARLARVEVELRSGMVLQVDIIPATGTALLHDQHRGRHRAGRRVAARRARRRLPGGLGADRRPAGRS